MKKALNTIGNFFSKINKAVRGVLYSFFHTKFMLKVGYVLAWIPNWINDRLDNKQRKAMWGMILIIPLVIGVLYFFLIPFILTIQYSFSYVEKFDGQQGLSTIWIGFNNYSYVFKEFTAYVNYKSALFPKLLLESFLEILLDLPIILIFSLIMAVVLNSKFKGRTFVRAIFFMPVIFNSQAIDIASKANAMGRIVEEAQKDIFETMFSFNDFLLSANLPPKMVNILTRTSKKIYDIISYSGIQILIFLAAIQSVPKHLYEAAKIEGATSYEMFWKITFPMVSPMLLTTAVYTIVDSYSRSMMVKSISLFTNPQRSESKFGLTGEALDTYNKLKFGDDTSQYITKGLELSNYGIGAALSLLYALMVIVLMLIVVAILSRMVFYYDK